MYLYDDAGAPIGMKYRTPSYANGVFDCYFFEKNMQGDIIAVYNTVYALKDEAGDIRYVGRTKNLDARLKAHEASDKTGDLTLAFYCSGLSWTQARGLEQVGIFTYNTINEGRNSINGVSPKNQNRIPYLTSAWDYIYNQISNEIYNLAGK